MKKIYSKYFKRVRKERLKFANNECEVAIYGREVCKNFELECHHKDNEAYNKDELGTISINDVIIVCKICHDFLTDCRRKQRFAVEKLAPSLVIPEKIEVRKNVEKTKISPNIGLPFNDAECSKRRPDK